MHVPVELSLARRDDHSSFDLRSFCFSSQAKVNHPRKVIISMQGLKPVRGNEVAFAQEKHCLE